jgi:hypothetical protein
MISFVIRMISNAIIAPKKVGMTCLGRMRQVTIEQVFGVAKRLGAKPCLCFPQIQNTK